MRYILLNSIFFLSLLTPVFSQENRCGTTEASKELYRDHPELLQKQAEYNVILQQKIAEKQLQRSPNTDQVYIIPVVFHVIHTNGNENISDEQIQDQINILNRDYRKLNADLSGIAKNTPFDTIAADIKIEFRLAQIDPKGNCTNGIDRIYSQLSNNGGNQSKLNQWPRDKYLNIWTVRSIGAAGVAGFAYFPSDVSTYLAPYDGIILLSDYIGSIGTSSVYNSRALTHEVGHYLGLYHPWGSTNSPEVDCSGDDQVADTPPTRGHLSCDLYTPFCTVYNLLNTSYKFSSVTTSSGATDPSAVPVNTGATFGAAKAVGVSANSKANASFAFTNWGTGGDTINHDTAYAALSGAINTGKYYEVTITPTYKNSLTITKMSFSFKRDSTGVRTYAVRSSLDGFTSNLAASVSPANKAIKVQPGNIFFSFYDTTAIQNGSTITVANYKNQITPITFRIYGWNAEDTAGTFDVDSLTFFGSSGVIENTQNYMDYSYCSVMFTKGQKDRMRATLENAMASRNNLWTTNNLIATGTNGNGQLCAPVSDFYTYNPLLCAGQSITYYSNVLNSMPAAPLTYQWEFTGGNPSTSTQANPSVNYPKTGYFDVKLTVSNSAGSTTTSKIWYVYVRDNGGDFLLSQGFNEGFEDLDRYNFQWQRRDLDDNGYGWQRADVGFGSAHSVRMNGYGNFQTDIDQLISPPFNMYSLLDLKLSFRCAAATKATIATEMNDLLNISYSVNCGSTWSNALNLSGAALFKNGYHPEYFVPNSDAQWALYEANIPVQNPNNKIIFKFEYKTGSKSNNIYIDNINLSGAVGINELVMQENNISIYPNPASEFATLTYRLNQRGHVTIELCDMIGKQIAKMDQGTQTEGEHTLILSKNELKLNTGVYFVRFMAGKSSITRKLIITD